MEAQDMAAGRRANDKDAAAGGRVAKLRQERGMSREVLGKACGVSGQQIRKYEDGTNRMSVSRSYDIAKALGTTVTYLMGSPEPMTMASRRTRAAELTQLGMQMDDAMLDHVLAVVRATVHRD